ncbi:MAG: HAD family phosphatase [Clostridiales bacterium]|nr:HAD family phosphatase [Clostridiales bacterium]
MIDGFVFDMDGVLFGTEQISHRCLEITAKGFNIIDILSIANKCVGTNAVRTREIYMEELGNEFPYDEFRDVYRGHVRQIICDEGLPIKPGAYMLLEYLKTNRYPVALATSTSKESTMSHLEESKMKEYFDAIITGDMVANGKPAPDIYLKACESVGINPTRSIALEDSPNGLKAATAAGMRAIMIPDCIPYSKEFSSFVSDHFNSLSDVLEALRKGELF